MLIIYKNSAIMKRIVNILLVSVIAMLIVSCGYTQRKNRIQLYEDLYIIQVDGNTKGVINIKTGDTIVKPSAYASITADENIITCQKFNKQLVPYTHKGERLGSFDFFTHWKESGNYYIGSSYRSTCIYFPQTDAIIRNTSVYCCPECMFIKMNDHWDICDYSGSSIWKVPLDITLIKDCNHKVLVAKPTNNKGIILYQCDGTEVKTLSFNQWKKLQKDFVITSDTPLNYAEIENEFSY